MKGRSDSESRYKTYLFECDNVKQCYRGSLFAYLIWDHPFRRLEFYSSIREDRQGTKKLV